MEGLTEGRNVHYVLTGKEWETCFDDPVGKHRPGIVVDVIDPELGSVILHVLVSPRDGYCESEYKLISNLSITAEYSENKEPGTWHWMERA